jgi:trans-2,3-dihydro-3-hydroxyanthranilate isomerase
MDWKFVQVDVFTDQPFGGNSLAVFTEGHQVPEDMWQPLAKEMNLSETTFVLPPNDPQDAAVVRIFTPGAELPFAGHPTIGTAYVLATAGSVASNQFSFEERVGRIPIEVEGDLREPGIIWMQQPLPVLGPPLVERDRVAQRIGVETNELLDIPIRTASAGVPFLFIGLKSPESVDRLTFGDRDLSTLAAGGAQGVFVFAPLSEDAANVVYSRMLGSHGLGIVEDPATGGASGPLGALLVVEGVFPSGAEVNILSRQGVAMGRPSEVYIQLTYGEDELTRVRVGGQVVPILEGMVHLPGRT